MKEIKQVKDRLRLFRNSVFHILPENNEPVLMPDSFTKIFMDPESEGSILKIHSQMGKSLKRDFARRIAEIPNKVKMLHNITDEMPEEYLIYRLYFAQGAY